jgi:hypothetical protein
MLEQHVDDFSRYGRFLIFLPSTFCLDAKSSKKIKAVEKWLKITAFALKPANSPEQSFMSKTLLARTVPALFAFGSLGSLRNFLNAIFLRPVVGRFPFIRTERMVQRLADARLEVSSTLMKASAGTAPLENFE